MTSSAASAAHRSATPIPFSRRAIAAQSKKLLHTSNLFFTEHTADLALRLTEISGLDRVFFCNSGTEAWEAALKLTPRLRGEESQGRRHPLALGS